MWVPDLPPPAINLPVVRLTNDAMPVTRNTYAVEESEKLRRSQVVALAGRVRPRARRRGSLRAAGGARSSGWMTSIPRALQRAQEGTRRAPAVLLGERPRVQPVRDGAPGFGPGGSDAGTPRPAGDAHGRSRRSARGGVAVNVWGWVAIGLRGGRRPVARGSRSPARCGSWQPSVVGWLRSRRRPDRCISPMGCRWARSLRRGSSTDEWRRGGLVLRDAGEIGTWSCSPTPTAGLAMRWCPR